MISIIIKLMIINIKLIIIAEINLILLAVEVRKKQGRSKENSKEENC